MKLICYILTTMIMFLIAKPVGSMILFQNNQEYSCCDSMCTPKESKKEKNENKDCTGKNCNPFQVCNSCVFILNQITNFIQNQPKIEISKKQKIEYQLTFVSQFIPDFWQPPKIA